MILRGRTVVLAIFVLASLAAGWAWYAQYSGSRNCLKYFGGDKARVIRQGESVWLWRLTAPPDAGAASSDGSHVRLEDLPAGEPMRIDALPGLTHLRHAILVDRTYDWDAPQPVDRSIQWDLRLVFRGESGEAELLVDLDEAYLRLSGRERVLSFAPAREAIMKVLAGADTSRPASSS